MTRQILALSAALLLVAESARADSMPQLDFANPLLTSQVVWGAIIFAGFYVAVSRFGLPRVGAILENRERTIAADLEQARVAKQTADRAVADLNEARRAAYAESQAAVAAATQKAKEEAATLAAKANARLDKQLADAEAQIGAARAGAMAALREVAAETATAIVVRLTGGRVDTGRVGDAVGAALQRRGLAGDARA
jgi:F-type H+-transporting ATPase subunit b